jgi:restriction system protein
MADKADDPPFPFGRSADEAIQANWAAQRRQQAYIAATSSPPAMGMPLTLRSAQQVIPSITIPLLIIPEGKTSSGLLVGSTSEVWDSIVKELGDDWSNAFKIPSERWEEIIAGAFKRDGYNEVTLTPRSGDFGRDVIAIKRGVGCVKVLGSVKAYAPDHVVPYDAVRALIGVITGERDTSKGIITTTSGFPLRIESDINIAPFLPTRLELIDGGKLQGWLKDLSKRKSLR